MITIITALYKSDKYLPSYAKKINVVAEVLTENNIKFEFILVPQLPTNNEKLIFDFSFSNKGVFGYVISSLTTT